MKVKFNNVGHQHQEIDNSWTKEMGAAVENGHTKPFLTQI